MTVNINATEFLNNLPKTNSITSTGECIFCPQDAELMYLDDGKLYMKVANGEYTYQKELIEIIDVEDALQGIYRATGMLAPRKYAESAMHIPTHLCTQCIIVSTIRNEEDMVLLHNLVSMTQYGKGDYDKLWLTSERMRTGQNLIIMNRRIGGWDGSRHNPVIELLGAGGHVPSIWNGSGFVSNGLTDNLCKEVAEELRMQISPSSFMYLGGFYNNMSCELVLLFSLRVDIADLLAIQSSALGNVNENIDGIYIGDFEEVMELYLQNASHFAGGEKAKLTNFPMQETLMKRIRKLFL